MRKIYTLFILLSAFCFTGLYGQKLVNTTYLQTMTTAQINGQLQPFNLTAKFNVDLYKTQYLSTGTDGNPDTLSGLMAIPQVIDEDLAVICYQHGTTDGRMDVPSNLQAGSSEAILFASQGYFCTAADYHGLGDSRGFHPYVHDETQARAGIDLLRAATEYATANDISFNNQIFLTGYSQGGHASMAMHRMIETTLSNEFTVTAAAHMSGPYSLSGEMRGRVLSDLPYFFAGYIPYLMIGYNEVYGDLFVSLEEVFKPNYVPILENFNDPDYSLFDINTQLIVQLFADFAASVPKRMLQDSVLVELETNPDHWTNQVLAKNDNYNWVPEAPTRMYYCEADEQVVYTNAIVADSFMNANGAENTAALSMGTNLDHGGCVPPAFQAGLAFFNSFLITSSTQELSVSDNWLLFPNPGDKFVNIRMADGSFPHENLRIVLTDTHNKHIGTYLLQQGSSYEMPVYNLPNGVYFLQMHTAEGVSTQKLVIQH